MTHTDSDRLGMPPPLPARGAAAFTSHDPGTKEVASARFLNGRCIDVTFHPADGSDWWERQHGQAFDFSIFEVPQLDSRPPQHTIALGIAGALVARAHSTDVRQVPVQEWKGSQRKPQHHLRAWAALTREEQEILGGATTLKIIRAACEKGARDRWRKPGGKYYGQSTAAKVHNLLDAVFLGLYYLGRIDSKGKPARIPRSVGKLPELAAPYKRTPQPRDPYAAVNAWLAAGGGKSDMARKSRRPAGVARAKR